MRVSFPFFPHIHVPHHFETCEWFSKNNNVPQTRKKERQREIKRNSHHISVNFELPDEGKSVKRNHLRRKENGFQLFDYMLTFPSFLRGVLWILWSRGSHGWIVLMIFILEIRRQTVDSTFSVLKWTALPLKESLPQCDNRYVIACVHVPLVKLLCYYLIALWCVCLEIAQNKCFSYGNKDKKWWGEVLLWESKKILSLFNFGNGWKLR